AFDNALSGYASTSVGVGMGVSVPPFGASHVYGSTSAFEGVFHLSGSPSLSCHSRNAQLYLDVFEKYYEFYGGNSRREYNTAFRVICRSQDAQLYLDVFQKYFECCEGKSRRECNTVFKGTTPSTELGRVNSGKQKLQTDDANDVFKSYSALCSRI
ncbi:hypothetical protein Tco_0119347, partial [Tanacetum coccineum]